MQLPQSTKPKDDPVALWSLQQTLLPMAEHLLGPRDSTRKIYQPAFCEAGPFIRNTPDMDGAFATLSLNAAGYWPTAVFELAHETVHLLNPIPGGTNFLEEGIAVAFSHIAMQRYGQQPFEQNATPPYAEALRLVRSLPPDIFPAAKSIRSDVGALSKVTLRDLERMFPAVERPVLCKLTEPFPLR